MKTRFNDEVSAFLENLNISMDTNIFDYMLYEMLGLKIPNTDLSYSNIYFDDSTQKFSLRQFSGLTLKELDVLLNYFEIARDTYRTNSQFSIEPSVFFSKVMPDVLAYINRLSLGSPSKLKTFQIKSRPKLEKNALEKVMEALTPLVVTTLANPALNAGVRAEITSTGAQLMISTGLLENSHGRKEEKIMGVMETVKIMHERLAAIITTHIDLEKTDAEAFATLTKTLEALSIYAKFNRIASMLAVNNFFKELATFTEGHAISTAATNIFEETLLRLAEIKSIPTECHFERDYQDRSRLDFEITGITPEEGQNLITWFHSQGDQSAMARDAHDIRHYATESAGRDYSEDKSYTLRLNVDGELLYTNIFPLFKSALEEMSLNQPGLLKAYQDNSVAHFTGKMKDDLKKLISSIYRTISEEKLAPAANTALLSNLQDRLKDLERSLECKNPQDLAEAKYSLHQVWMIAAAKADVTTTGKNVEQLFTQLDQYYNRIAPIVPADAVETTTPVAEEAETAPAANTETAPIATVVEVISAEKEAVVNNNPTLFRRGTLLALKDKKLDAAELAELKIESTSPKM